MIDTKMYLGTVREALKDGWRTADILNKRALDIELITVDQYRVAAQEIVAAYKAEVWR